FHNVLIEGNLIDNNGWNSRVNGAERTIFNHGIYFQVDSSGMVVRDNIISNNASHGLQARAGGIVENNLFVGNAIGMSMGYVLGARDPKDSGVSGEITNNVFLDGTDITEKLPRGMAVEVGNMQRLLLENNIIANDASYRPYGFAIALHGDNGMG